jgi:hypothetical protein
MKNNLLNTIYLLCGYARTDYESKKHGGYNIYSDDKIECSYDTYYPNIEVYVKHDDKKTMVLMHNGGGFNQTYHPGKWEDYILSLREFALSAKQKHDENRESQKEKERLEKFGNCPDKLNSIFV